MERHGATVDYRISAEVLKVISPLGLAASLRAIEELSAGDTAQRAALSRKLEALEYEARRAFEQYDVVDARNRLAAAELERRWNEKLHEIEIVKEQLSGVAEKRYSLSSEDEANILSMGENFAATWHNSNCPSTLRKMIAPRAPWHIHRADLCAEPVEGILKLLRKTGKLVLPGGRTETQPALPFENQSDDNDRHYE